MKKMTLSILGVVAAGLLFAPQALAAEPDNATTEVEIFTDGQTESTVHLVEVPNLQFKYKGTITKANTDGTFNGGVATSSGGAAVGDLVVKDDRAPGSLKGWTVTLRGQTPKSNTVGNLPLKTFKYAAVTNSSDKFTGTTNNYAQKAMTAVNILETTATVLTRASQTLATEAHTGLATVSTNNIYSEIELTKDAKAISGGIYTGSLTYTLVENLA